MTKRLLVLGAGRHQKNLIRRAEEMGIECVVSDYYPDAPGKQFASLPTLTDALDVEANIRLGREHGISGVITTGTDLAVMTMAEVAHALDLPCYLTPEAARNATNKLFMKEAFRKSGVPHARYCEVDDAGRSAAVLEELDLPYVVKPSDSQGQRGTRMVREAGELVEALELAIQESTTSLAVVEEFLEGCEVTASGWMFDGRPQIFMVTDRVTYNPPPAIGICFQHVYPSAHAAGLTGEIQAVIERMMQGYGVTQGPFYVQMIIHDGKPFIVEGACRVGGGHEASLIPTATGVEITDRLIQLALEGKSGAPTYEYDENAVPCHALVNFLLPRPGTIAEAHDFAELVAAGRVAEGEFYESLGHACQPITNSLGRVGYFIAVDETRPKLLQRAEGVYSDLTLRDATGENLLFWPESELVNGV